MRSIKTGLASAVVLLLTAVSAMAASNQAEVPEPNTIALLSLGGGRHHSGPPLGREASAKGLTAGTSRSMAGEL